MESWKRSRAVVMSQTQESEWAHRHKQVTLAPQLFALNMVLEGDKVFRHRRLKVSVGLDPHPASLTT